MSTRASLIRTLAAAAALALSACAGAFSSPPATSASPASAPASVRVVGPLSDGEARALATMNVRLKEYMDLHARLERSLPVLDTDSTAEQIDLNQRSYERLLRTARKDADEGDIFTDEARPVIRRLLRAVFSGPDGQQVRASIFDENPPSSSPMKVSVNRRIPAIVPLGTVPPRILQTLPMLSENLEYRFVGDSLILFDTHAHVIADFIDNAIPK